ncbi:hypothetical protein JOD67_003192 [Tenggerimyces flavus]|nr:hypothetical protein [Tenggerimyces flavus]
MAEPGTGGLRLLTVVHHDQLQLVLRGGLARTSRSNTTQTSGPVLEVSPVSRALGRYCSWLRRGHHRRRRGGTCSQPRGRQPRQLARLRLRFGRRGRSEWRWSCRRATS